MGFAVCFVLGLGSMRGSYNRFAMTQVGVPNADRFSGILAAKLTPRSVRGAA